MEYWCSGLPLAGIGSWVESTASWLAQQVTGASAPVALAIFFLCGVLASLTPCVYPMIPIVVTYMGGAETAAAAQAGQEGRRRRVVLRALAYIVGLSVVYTGLGLTAILLAKPFGSLTQTFWGYAVVGLVLVIFGLSLLGLYEIRVPAFIMNRMGTGPREGYLGAVLMGATSAIVAAPCAAPIVFPLAAIVSREGRVVFGTVAMFFFSLGLGALFLLLGIFSGMAASMPRPGGWMVRLKQAVGLLMVLIAVYFFYQGYTKL